jgi:hypothetical protein
LPNKISITRLPLEIIEVRDLEEARGLPFNFVDDALVLVEGYSVKSYEELMNIAQREEFKKKDTLQVVVLNYEFPDGG